MFGVWCRVSASAPLSISANKLLILSDKQVQMGPIPAYGSAEFKFNIRNKSLLDSFSDQITIYIGGQKFTKDVTIKPFILFQTIPAMIGVVIALMVLVYMVVLGGHYYQKRLKKRSVVEK